MYLNRDNIYYEREKIIFKMVLFFFFFTKNRSGDKDTDRYFDSQTVPDTLPVPVLDPVHGHVSAPEHDGGHHPARHPIMHDPLPDDLG
jgi:hypothetical protein